jgi:hypothetical protein
LPSGAESRRRRHKIIAIGLGDENEAREFRLPAQRENFPEYQAKKSGQARRGLLRNIVYVTDGGKYLSVSRYDTTGQIYENLIASAEKRELESTTMLKYDRNSRYSWY